MRRRRLLAAWTGAFATSLGGCSSLSGAIRELEFAGLSHERTDAGVRVTAEIMTNINVEGEAGNFDDVIVLGYSCATDGLVCRTEVGTVTREASRENPVVATMECDRLPDVVTFDADPGPCDGLGTITMAVLTPDGWVTNAFERECDDVLPPDRTCEVTVGSTTG